MPDPIRDFFDAIRRTAQQHAPAGGMVGQVVGAYAPRCHICNKVALIPIRCALCNLPMCETHGFFNATGLGLCSACIQESGGIELDLDGSGFIEDGAAPDSGFPWTTLKISPTKDIKAIKQAYRRLATKDHPDHYEEGTEEHRRADGRFKRLTVAYNEALSMAKGE